MSETEPDVCWWLNKIKAPVVWCLHILKFYFRQLCVRGEVGGSVPASAAGLFGLSDGADEGSKRLFVFEVCRDAALCIVSSSSCCMLGRSRPGDPGRLQSLTRLIESQQDPSHPVPPSVSVCSSLLYSLFPPFPPFFVARSSSSVSVKAPRSCHNTSVWRLSFKHLLQT